MEEPSGRPVTDLEVRRLWEAGDREGAYRRVVEATEVSLYRYLLSLLRDEDAAREVFQETYLRVFRGLGGFRGEASLTTWVLTVARNLTWNRLRRAGLRRGRELPLEAVPEPRSPEEPVDPVSRTLLAALDALPGAQREAVMLFYLEDLSVAEVARVTGRAVNTVKSDLLRARRALRGALDETTVPVTADGDEESRA